MLPISMVLLLALFGCGDTKMIRRPEPVLVTQPLAAALDQHLAVELNAVIFRGGPGSWAKNADWDEYLILVRNVGDESIEIVGITVVDSLGTRIEPGLSRRQLGNGPRKMKRRDKGEGLKVKAGINGGVLVVAGVGSDRNHQSSDLWHSSRTL